MWNAIQLSEMPSTDQVAEATSLLAFYRKEEKKPSKLDDATWKVFREYINATAPEAFMELVQAFEWSTKLPTSEDLIVEIVHQVMTRLDVTREVAEVVYARLFLHVMKVISNRGFKKLESSTLSSHVSLPDLRGADVRLFKLLQNEVLSLGKRVDDLENTTAIHGRSLAVIEEHLRAQHGTSEIVRFSNTSVIDTKIPPQVNGIARRADVVASFLNEIRERDWLSICGTVGSGKTQLATLLAEALSQAFYLSFRDMNSNEADLLLQQVLQQLASTDDLGAATDHALRKLGEQTVIFLDDVPQIHSGDRLANRLLDISQHMGSYTQTLVTLTHFPIPTSVVERITDDTFREFVIPPMKVEELRDFMVGSGCPSESAANALAGMLVVKAKGNPTLLAAIVRSLQANDWSWGQEIFDDVDDITDETVRRVLDTVESENDRSLLYRLSVIIGSFGKKEVAALANISPAINERTAAYARLKGLWIEQAAGDQAFVCPLVTRFGTAELAADLHKSVASALAVLAFESKSISPIDFAKGVRYHRIANEGAMIGLRIIGGLDSATSLPDEWRRIIYGASSEPGLLEGCPNELALLANAKRIALAATLEEPIDHLVDEGKHFVDLDTEFGRLTSLFYASIVGPEIMKVDYDEGLRLCDITINNWDDSQKVWDGFAEENPVEFEVAPDEVRFNLPWMFASELETSQRCLDWFHLFTDLPKTVVQKYFSIDLAGPGIRHLLDRLWIREHEKPSGQRDLSPAIEVYEFCREFFASRGLPLGEALAARSAIIVEAEYLSNIQRAEQIATEILERDDCPDEVRFLILDVIGRQHCYAGSRGRAIQELSDACQIDTGTFDSIRCRSFLELSCLIGDNDSFASLKHAQAAVAIARRNAKAVPILELVTALGEASVAAGILKDYPLCFKLIDECFVILRQCDERDTVDWKMRFVILANALGYFMSMAATGNPPDESYTVPIRRTLLDLNELAASWYDESPHTVFDLSPTTLALFANEVGATERAVYWANQGLDEAKEKGSLPSIRALAEVLVPAMITSHEIAKSLDYAFESAVAFHASMTLFNETQDIGLHGGHDAISIVNSADGVWGTVISSFSFFGVIPAVVYACTNDDHGTELLDSIISECESRNIELQSLQRGTLNAVVEVLRSFESGRSRQAIQPFVSPDDVNEWSGGRVVALFLSSFCANASLEQQAFEQTMGMYFLSRQVATSCPTWSFVTIRLVEFWKNQFENARFQFSSPKIVEQELRDLSEVHHKVRFKALVKVLMAGLKFRFSNQVQPVADWLNEARLQS
ncbi:MAG: hypothetical protein R3C18_17665 [Planctomycetaceae bacterium]